MDKQILNDYIDACAQVKETKEALLKLRKAKKRREQDAVKGSSHEFPYTAQTFHIEGIAYPLVQDPGEEDHLEFCGSGSGMLRGLSTTWKRG